MTTLTRPINAEDHIDSHSDPIIHKPLVIDIPYTTLPMDAPTASTLSSPEWPSSTSLPLVKGLNTDPSIEAHFHNHFQNHNVYITPKDERRKASNGEEIGPDINIPVITAVKALTNLSPDAKKYFEEEYLADIYVFVNTAAQLREFAPVALMFPGIGGRIKLDSRCGGEEERKEEFAKILELTRGAFPLTEDGFKDLILTKAPLPLQKSDMYQLDQMKRSNPRGNHFPRVPADLKLLKHRDGWKVQISCDSVLQAEDVQKLQVWDDIGRLTRLWKHYASRRIPEQEEKHAKILKWLKRMEESDQKGKDWRRKIGGIRSPD